VHGRLPLVRSDAENDPALTLRQHDRVVDQRGEVGRQHSRCPVLAAAPPDQEQRLLNPLAWLG
jgi:hypothetical protein